MTELVINGHNNSLSYPLQVTISVNDKTSEYLLDGTDFQYKFDGNSSQPLHYQIRITVSGKKQHLEKISTTNLDQHEDIISAAFIIDKITVDGHDASAILNNVARYHYCDAEDNSKFLSESFTTWLGHDGYQQFELITPTWAWFLLEYKF